MFKRLLALLTVVVLLGSMLAACGAPQQAEEPPADDTEAETTPAEGEEAEEAEEGEEEPAEPAGTGEFEGTIKIATQSPLSGPQAAIGTGIKNAADLAIEQNASILTDMGFEVELAPFDDEAQPEKGSANANNIVSDSDILCMNGHYNSGVALAALPTYEAASLVMVSPGNTNPDITDGNDVAFRIVGRDDVQGVVGEQFAREELGIESVYILHDQTDYGQGIANFFRQSAEENGVEVVGFEGTQEQSVFDSILTPIQAAEPDLIYFGGIFSQAGPLFSQARDRGIEAMLMGPDGLDSPELANLAGDAVDGMHYTTVAAPVSQFPDAEQFAEDYEAAYGDPAPPFAAQGYDVTGICMTAIAQAAEEVGGKPTREQVLEAMRNLGTFEGITGAYEFNENGDPAVANYFVLQVNVDDWDANEVAAKLEVAPPGGDEMAEEETIEEELDETEEMTDTEEMDETEEMTDTEEMDEMEEEEADEAETDEEETDAAEPSGAFEGNVRIAMQAPLSGPQSALGTGLKNGATLAIDQLGVALTDLGFEVELAPFDDEAQAEKGAANATNIVSDPDILCMMGHLNSGVSLAALPTYEPANLVMISPSNTTPAITDDYDVAFRVVGRDEVQGAVAEQFISEDLGVESVYILHDQTDYGQGIADFFRQNAEEDGIEVMGFEGTQEESIFDSILTPIQAANPDLIFFGGVYDQTGPFFNQARDRGIESIFMGPDATDSPAILDLAGDTVAGMYYTTIAGPVSEFPGAAQFAEDYEAEFGESAPPFSPQAYDATGLCIKAIADAAEQVGGMPEREDVLEAMQNLETYEGVTGTFDFNEQGDPSQATYFIMQVEGEDWDNNEIVNRLEVAPPGTDDASMDDMDQTDEMTETDAPEE